MKKKNKISWNYSGVEIWATINDIVSTIALIFAIIAFILKVWLLFQ